jgi:hypothetical protein
MSVLEFLGIMRRKLASFEKCLIKFTLLKHNSML